MRSTSKSQHFPKKTNRSHAKGSHANRMQVAYKKLYFAQQSQISHAKKNSAKSNFSKFRMRIRCDTLKITCKINVTLHLITCHTHANYDISHANYM